MRNTADPTQVISLVHGEWYHGNSSTTTKTMHACLISCNPTEVHKELWTSRKQMPLFFQLSVIL